MAEWQARRTASFQLRQQQPSQEPQHLTPQSLALPPYTPQLIRHNHQSSISSLPPSDPVTPHTNVSTSTRGADRPGGGSSSASEAGDDDSGSQQPSSRFATPYPADDSPQHAAAPRHRLQPSWPQLSTSGGQRNERGRAVTVARLCARALALNYCHVCDALVGAAEIRAEDDEDPAELFDIICQLGGCAVKCQYVLLRPVALRTELRCSSQRICNGCDVPCIHCLGSGCVVGFDGVVPHSCHHFVRLLAPPQARAATAACSRHGSGRPGSWWRSKWCRCRRGTTPRIWRMKSSCWPPATTPTSCATWCACRSPAASASAFVNQLAAAAVLVGTSQRQAPTRCRNSDQRQ